MNEGSITLQVSQSDRWSVKAIIGRWETDAAEEMYLDTALNIGNKTFGSQGIQAQYNDGSPRFYVGDGSNKFFQFDGTDPTWKGANTELNSSGNLICAGGTIGGWTISATKLSSANIEIDDGNDRIRSTNYVSGPFGVGFTLEPNLLEVGNIACRGIIRTAVFQKDVISTVGGWVMIPPVGSDVLTIDMTAADSSTLTIEGNETFAIGDILRIREETEDEWLEVTDDSSAPTYTVVRDKKGVHGPDSNPAWKKGATVVGYGQSGDGGILLTASATNAPYMSMFTHAGSPWSSTTTYVRLGNLNSSYGYSSDVYGIGLGDSTLSGNYLKFDDSSGILTVKGSIVVESSSTIAGIDADLIASEHRNFHDVFDDPNSDVDTRWAVSGTGETSIISSSDSVTGGHFWRIGDNSGNDGKNCIYYKSIPFDPTILYRVRVRARRTAGSGTIYVGVAGRNYDDTAWVNISGADSVGNQYYCACSGRALGSSWEVHTGYFKGTDTTGESGEHQDPGDPAKLHEDVRYFRPYIIVNYSGQTGTTEIDEFLVEAITDTEDMNWRHATDTTKIDGGTIYTSSIVLASAASDFDIDTIADGSTYKKMTVNQQSGANRAYSALDASNVLVTKAVPATVAGPSGAGLYLGSDYMGYYNGSAWRAYIDNSGNFYCGNGANEYIQVSSGALTLSTAQADAITIKSGGDIKLEEGGDIKFPYGTSNTAKMLFYTSSSYQIQFFAQTDWFKITPDTDDVITLYIGQPSYLFSSLYLYGGSVTMYGRHSSNDYASVQSTSSASSSDINLGLVFGGSSKTLISKFSSTELYFTPSTDKDWDLGLSSFAWDDAYADDWNNVADFFLLDSKDDLKTINDIRGNGETDKRTGLELIDDNSLAEWLLTKDKEGKEILRDSEGKPYLSMKMISSLLMGAIKQLNAKYEKHMESLHLS